MKTIAIAGTFDTKGKEYLYVKGPVSYTHLDVYKRQADEGTE